MTRLLPNTKVPGSQFSTSQSGWHYLKPDVRAAILVSPAIILYEIISSLAPVAGFAITFPLALATYLVQGMLVGRLAASNKMGLTDTMRLGALSGLWTSVLVSTAVTLVILIIATPISLGTFLLGVPAILAASLFDLCFNVSLSALGAWLYGRLGGKIAAGLSCLLGVAGLTLTCSLAGGAGVILAGLLLGRIHIH